MARWAHFLCCRSGTIWRQRRLKRRQRQARYNIERGSKVLFLQSSMWVYGAESRLKRANKWIVRCICCLVSMTLLYLWHVFHLNEWSRTIYYYNKIWILIKHRHCNHNFIDVNHKSALVLCACRVVGGGWSCFHFESKQLSIRIGSVQHAACTDCWCFAIGRNRRK